MSPKSVRIRWTTKSAVTGVPFDAIAREILGPRYELSVLVCGDTLMHRLNREYRKKDYATNVLAFPLSDTEGEIILNLRKIEREAKALSELTKHRTTFLFIHACLHLKGHDHGEKMERLEEKYLAQYTKQ